MGSAGVMEGRVKEQLEHCFVVQITACFCLLGDAERPYATYLLG